MLSKVTFALAGEEALKNHCAYCHGKFGMVRHRRAFKTFCSQKCVAHHKAWLRAEARKRKGWFETGLAGWGRKTRTQESYLRGIDIINKTAFQFRCPVELHSASLPRPAV